MNLLRIIIIFSSFFLLNNSFAVERGISLSQTRVIFDGSLKSTKITINNQSERVYLIKSSVQVTPEKEAYTSDSDNVPFMITPPLFRLEENSRNTILVIANDVSNLATDRESVFYLSFLAIPSVNKIEHDKDNVLQSQVSIGIRTVIKLFYRPKGLNYPINSAPGDIIFQQVNSQLRIENPTPYYINLAQLNINDNSFNLRDKSSMLAPLSTQYYPLKEKVRQVSWSTITDYGGLSQLYHAYLD